MDALSLSQLSDICQYCMNRVGALSEASKLWDISFQGDGTTAHFIRNINGEKVFFNIFNTTWMNIKKITVIHIPMRRKVFESATIILISVIFVT